jgi:hypothetical protein
MQNITRDKLQDSVTKQAGLEVMLYTYIQKVICSNLD